MRVRLAVLLVVAALAPGAGAAEEALVEVWNRTDLTQFAPGSVRFSVRSEELRGSAGPEVGDGATLRIPFKGGATARILLVVKSPAAGGEVRYGWTGTDPVMLSDDLAAVLPETTIDLRRSPGRIEMQVAGRVFAAKESARAPDFIEVGVRPRGFVRILAVSWYAIPEPEARPPEEGGGEGEEPPTEREVSGTLREDDTWSGDVFLAGDFVIPQGVTLRIEPGTRIHLRPREGAGDDRSRYYDMNSRLLEIHVLGRVEALGSEDAPIRIGEKPERERGRIRPTWVGIVCHADADPGTRFSRLVVRGAVGGIQCAGGKPAIEDSVFLECGVGVGAGTVYSSYTFDRVLDPRGPTPQIRRCRFGGCDTGVYVDVTGRPAIERSIFLGCRLAIGGRVTGYSRPITALGPIVTRCDFLRNRVCNQGSSSVTDSIFSGNELVFRASSFHRDFTTTIDRYHRAGNVYFDNQAFAVDDIPAGAGSRFVDPGYAGALPADPEVLLLPGVERSLRLSAASAARGAASDGGDPGAYGREGVTGERRWAGYRPEGDPILEWLSPGPPWKLDLREVVGDLRGAPRSGLAAGGGLWCRLRGSAEGGDLHLALPPYAPPDQEILLATAVRFQNAGEVRLDVGIDGWLRELRFGDRSITAPSNRRRYAADDVTARLDVTAGEHLLLIRVLPDRPRARFSAYLTPSPEVGGAALADDPERGRKPVKFDRLTAVARAGGQGWAILYFNGPLHWLDATDPDSFVLRDPDGRPIRLDPEDLRYEPGARPKIRIEGLDLTRRGEYTVAIRRMRDAWGHPVEGDRERTTEAK